MLREIVKSNLVYADKNYKLYRVQRKTRLDEVEETHQAQESAGCYPT